MVKTWDSSQTGAQLIEIALWFPVATNFLTKKFKRRFI